MMTPAPNATGSHGISRNRLTKSDFITYNQAIIAVSLPRNPHWEDYGKRQNAAGPPGEPAFRSGRAGHQGHIKVALTPIRRSPRNPRAPGRGAVQGREKLKYV